MHPLGCLAIFLVAAGLIAGIGMYLGSREDAAKTPCERYAKVVAVALDNCHSGVNRSHRHHIAICEQMVNPSSDCLGKIKKLSCDELERGPAVSVGDACLK